MRKLRRLAALVLAVMLVMSCVDLAETARALAGFTFPKALRRVEDEAFLNDTSLTGLVELPAGVESVGKRAFYGSGAYAVDFPSSVTKISTQAVQNSRINYVVVRSSSTALEANALAGVNYVFAPSGSTAQRYAEASGVRFVSLDNLRLEDGFYYELTDHAALLCARDATAISGAVSIPGAVSDLSVDEISANAFKGCEKLSALELPAGASVAEGALDPLGGAQISYRGVPMINAVSASVTGSVQAGESVLWSVDATSGTGALQYAFYLNRDGDVAASRDYGTSRFYSAVLNEAGRYSLTVVCKDEAGQLAVAESETIVVRSRPLAIVSIDSPDGDFGVGDTLTWTVKTEEGTQPILYSYVLYKDGNVVVDRVDMTEDNSYSYVPSEEGVYEIEVSCVDADETFCEMRSAEIYVLARGSVYPPAPELSFAEGETVFSQDEASAPECAPQRIDLKWAAVEDASAYVVYLEKSVSGEWVEVLRDEAVDRNSYPLSVSLFSELTERTLFRLSLASKGVYTGAANVYYFAVAPAVLDESLTIDGAESATWNQNSQYAATRTFEIGSALEWTVDSVQSSMNFTYNYSADWISYEIQENQLIVSIAESAEMQKRTAVITLSNGSRTATLNVNQGYADAAPVVTAPIAFSTDAQNPSEYPTGEFSLKWDEKDNSSVRVRVSERMSDGTLRQLLERATTVGYQYITADDLGEALKSGSVYVIELAGVYSSSTWAQYEREEDMLKSVYYVKMVDHGYSIKIDGRSTVVYRNILRASCHIEANGVVEYTSDVDWLSVDGYRWNKYNNEVTICAEQNTTGAAREGHITFMCGDAMATVTVIQDDMTPKVLYPESLSQTESSPTTLYMDLNLLDTNYFYFIYQGKRLYLEKYVDGAYGDMTKLHGSTSYGTHSVEIETSDVSGASWCRLTAVSDDVSSVYYVKFRSSDSYLYDTFMDVYMSKEEGAHQHTFKVTIGTTTKWTVSSNASWLKPAVSSGAAGVKASGYKVSFDVSVTANTTGRPRTGRLTLKSTTSNSICWVDVKQTADNIFVLCGKNPVNGEYEPYDPSVHSAGILKGAAVNTDRFIAYATDDIKVTPNVDWITASKSSPNSGAQFYLKLQANPAGNGVRTGTVTVSDGINSEVITVRQAPGLGDATLVSPSLSTDYDNPSVINYGDVRLVWNAAQNAVQYEIELYNANDIKYKTIARIDDTGASQYSYTVPKEMLTAFTTNDIYINAYDQYGYSNDTEYFFMPTPGDAALINGSTAPVWSNAPDINASREFIIQSSAAWKAAASQSWITLSAASGVSGDTLTVTLAENTGSQPRSGQVTVTVGSSKTVIKIDQCAYLAEEYPSLTSPAFSEDKANPTLIAPCTSLTVTWDPEPQAILYQVTLYRQKSTNIKTVIARSKQLVDGEGSYTFTGLELEKGQLYSVGIKRRSERYRYTGADYYFMLNDEEAWVKIDDLTAAEMEAKSDEDSEYFTITASGYWAAQTDDDWLLLHKRSVGQAELDSEGSAPSEYARYSGVSGDQLCVSTLANTTGKARTGKVYVTCGSAQAEITVTQYQSYTVAEITSPTLGTSRSDSVTLPYGAVKLQWSAAAGGTGRYKVSLYESETQNGSYSRAVYDPETPITARSLTLSSDVLSGGYYYKLYLETEIGEDDYRTKTYYFRMGRQNELTLTARLSSTDVKIGGYMSVEASASGGDGEYTYTYILMKDGAEVTRSLAHRGLASYGFAISEAGAYYVSVWVQDGDGTVASCNTETVKVSETILTPTITPTPTPTPVPGESGQPTQTVTPTPTPTVTPAPTATPTGEPTVVDAPVISKKAATGTDGTATISWSRVSSAAGYKIWRSAASEKEYVIIGVTGALTWKDTGLKNGETYYYKVQAVAADGTLSALSTSISVKATNTENPDGAQTGIRGQFGTSAYTAEIGGKTLQLTGYVSATGADISQITINVQGISAPAYTRLMTYAPAAGQRYIDLSQIAAFRPDTTSYPFNEPGTYTLQLWASMSNGMSVSEPLATATLNVIRFDASLGQSKTIVLGEKWQVNGTVSIEGGKLGRVTVNAYATADSNLSDDFTARAVSTINLQDWAAYTIDTSKAPFNEAKTYKIQIWAKDSGGTGGSHVLAETTVRVVEKSSLLSLTQAQVRSLVESTVHESWNEAGRYRAMTQGKYGGVIIPSTTFCYAYWGDLSAKSETGMCNRASASMALSYMGVDIKPKDFIGGSESVEGVDSFLAGYHIKAHRSASPQVSSFEQYYARFLKDAGTGRFSPVILYTKKSGNPHWITVIGQDSSDSSYYWVLDSGTGNYAQVKFKEDGDKLQIEKYRYKVSEGAAWKEDTRYGETYAMIKIMQYEKYD